MAQPVYGEGTEALQAKRAALDIMERWHERGYLEVRAETKITHYDGRDRPVWGIRSNLVNGLPPSMNRRWRT